MSTSALFTNAAQHGDVPVVNTKSPSQNQGGRLASPVSVEAPAGFGFGVKKANAFGIDSLDQVTDSQLEQFAELIYARTGVRVSKQKKMLLSNRLRRRLRETGIASFGDYYDHLQRLRPNDPEWDALIQEVTTHETFLFRDEVQWNWFRTVFLPGWSSGALSNGNRGPLRIWSAACSTGDEAFTIASCVAGGLPTVRSGQVRIVGTDIGIGAVTQAQQGVFGERSMRLAPEDFKRRFFTKLDDGLSWKAKPILMDMVAFRQHNLLAPLREPQFDLVFLKNVLIYFDAASKKRVMENIRAAVRPGGMLVTGAAEGVSDMLRDFRCLQPWLHGKPQ
jgi:chemotaxis protein methyltransferase CheR